MSSNESVSQMLSLKPKFQQLKAFKHVALQFKFSISIIYTLFSQNLERMQASVLPSKTVQEESSKITLKSQSKVD